MFLKSSRRLSCHLSIPRPRSALFDSSFSHSAARLLHTLPQNIGTTSSFMSLRVTSETIFDIYYPLTSKLYSTVIKPTCTYFSILERASTIRQTPCLHIIYRHQVLCIAASIELSYKNLKNQNVLLHLM